MKKLIIFGIGFYRRWVSPALPGSCRFHPSCSAYAMESVDRHGALRGSIKAAWRILRCNPWHPGGYDPVPPQAEPQWKEPGPSTVPGSVILSRGKQGEVVTENLPSDIAPAKIIPAPCAKRPAHSEH